MLRTHVAGVALCVALVGCGGGGSGGGTAVTAVTYQAVATAGELVSYSVDTNALTYSYRIVESAYGKTGATGSGQLTRNADGTFTPSGFPGKVAVLDNGLLVGGIYEDLDGNGTKEVVPILGVSSPITSLADAAGIYNFVSRQCAPGLCNNYYGTFRLNADGSWVSCERGDLAASSFACASSISGGSSSFSDGRARITVGGVEAGSLIIFKDPTSAQKVVLLDLNGKTVLGRGGVFAGSQGLPASADGNWHYAHTNGTVGIATVSGTTFTDSGKFGNGTAYGPLPGSFTKNQPWSGFVTTSNGAILLATGSGMYAAYFGTQGISIGVRR